jgi:hypothetical protein
MLTVNLMKQWQHVPANIITNVRLKVLFFGLPDIILAGSIEVQLVPSSLKDLHQNVIHFLVHAHKGNVLPNPSLHDLPKPCFPGFRKKLRIGHQAILTSSFETVWIYSAIFNYRSLG